jgi:hypothetical protein
LRVVTSLKERKRWNGMEEILLITSSIDFMKNLYNFIVKI